MPVTAPKALDRHLARQSLGDTMAAGYNHKKEKTCIEACCRPPNPRILDQSTGKSNLHARQSWTLSGGCWPLVRICSGKPWDPFHTHAGCSCGCWATSHEDRMHAVYQYLPLNSAQCCSSLMSGACGLGSHAGRASVHNSQRPRC